VGDLLVVEQPIASDQNRVTSDMRLNPSPGKIHMFGNGGAVQLDPRSD
jgi:hypothetical protein